MFSKRTKLIMKMTEDKVKNNTDLVDSSESSPPRSIPEEDMKLFFNSDDSEADPDYDIAAEKNCDFSSDDEISSCSKKIRKTRTESAKSVSSSENKNNNEEVEKSDSDSLTANPSTSTFTKKGTIRKRGLKGDTRIIRYERKEKRNAGKEYKTKSGKTIKQRIRKDLGECRNKCSSLIKYDNKREQLFEEYWKVGDFHRRLSYIASLLNFKEPKKTSKKSPAGKQISVEYNIEIDGDRIKICKGCFLKIFGETRRFISTAIKHKQRSTSGIISLDHKNTPSTSRGETLRSDVNDFLNKIPTYESHYSRRDCSKKFVSPHLTITMLHEEYQKTLKLGSQSASLEVFRKAFHAKRLFIKKPKVDTCATCDKLSLEKRVAEEEKKAMVQEKLDQHQFEADQAYEEKRMDKEISLNDPSKKTITFDLQQCLATPLLKNSVSFYKRTLWTYNLTIYDCDKNQTYCYVWHEAMARRGANEIASCLYQYFTTELEPTVKCVTMYSDSCPGQNKNSHMSAMCWVALQNSTHIEVIHHKFLVPGHTHMECDTSHALIERKQKTFQGPIEHPHDWAQLMRYSGKKKNL